MKYLYKVLIIIAFVSVTAFGFSRENREVFCAPDSQMTEIGFVNNKILIQNLPYSGKLQIYSVLGVNVATIEVKSGSGEYSVQLPKGYYIVKIADVVRKIAVK